MAHRLNGLGHIEPDASCTWKLAGPEKYCTKAARPLGDTRHVLARNMIRMKEIDSLLKPLSIPDRKNPYPETPR